MRVRRNILLPVLMVFLFNIPSFAQEMTEGNKLAGLGIGPAWNYYGYKTTGIPAFRGHLDYGIKNFEIGTIGIGAELGFCSRSYENGFWDATSYYTYKWTWTYFILAARGSYYYNFGELGIPKLNAYAGLSLGLRFSFFNDEYSGPPSIYPHKDFSNVYFHSAVFLGGNYYFTDEFAAFLEFGYDISPITIGVSKQF